MEGPALLLVIYKNEGGGVLVVAWLGGFEYSRLMQKVSL